MPNDKNIKIICVQNKESIFKAVTSLADCLFDQSINNEVTLQQLSEKFSNYATVLIAQIAEEIVGLCSFYDNDLTSLTAFLSMIVVKNSYQGHGIGNALIKTMIDFCRQNKMKVIRLEVDNNNHNAIVFYQKRGFVLESQNTKSSYYIINL